MRIVIIIQVIIKGITLHVSTEDSDGQNGETVIPIPSEVDHQEPEETEEKDMCDNDHDDLLGISNVPPNRKATEVVRMKIKLIGECHGLRVMMSLMTYGSYLKHV